MKMNEEKKHKYMKQQRNLSSFEQVSTTQRTQKDFREGELKNKSKQKTKQRKLIPKMLLFGNVSQRFKNTYYKSIASKARFLASI